MPTIVYFSFPAHGHINPTLSVVRELVRRRVPVVFYATEPFGRAIAATGAEFRPYGPKFRMPAHGPGPFARVSTTLETLLALTCTVLDDNLEETGSIAPTHIMFDSFAPWGAAIAQRLRLPAIVSVPSILVNGDIVARYERNSGAGEADPELNPDWYGNFVSRCSTALSRRGISAPPSPSELLQSYGDLNLVYTSAEFQPSADAFDPRRFRFVGPCFDFRPEVPDFPFERLDRRPVILVSLGTVYGDQPRFLRMCRDELAGNGWQVVVAAGKATPANEIGDWPENFIVRPWVPQIEILRRASAFVTHGGMNSVQEALYHGVPLILAPQGADQFWISARTEELGAGVVLNAVAKGRLRQTVEQVLADRAYGDAAARIGERLRAAGGHRRAAEEIERLF